jgi:hypothetical protein
MVQLKAPVSLDSAVRQVAFFPFLDLLRQRRPVTITIRCGPLVDRCAWPAMKMLRANDIASRHPERDAGRQKGIRPAPERRLTFWRSDAPALIHATIFFASVIFSANA